MKHLLELNETYLRHGAIALRFAAILFCLSIVAVVHAIVPWLFQNVTSNWITRLAAEMERRAA
tara:strand:+ start:555 stop:743 length:189 start_codon:yes stop_codon:yes gene_type:complete